MKRLAVISDVHSNLEALEAVLRETGELQTICLGDLVDYGANPNEVIELVRRRGIRTIMGNHDWAAVTGEVSLFNPRAAMSSVWTRKQISVENFEFLRGLSAELRDSLAGTRAYFTHGSPDDKLWEYVDPRTHSALFGHYLAKLGVKMIGLGHTHIPYVWPEAGGIVFNPGSVGQPRDGNPKAAYALVEVVEVKVDVELRRVAYDVEKAASKIRRAGLPEPHAARLFSGT